MGSPLFLGGEPESIDPAWETRIESEFPRHGGALRVSRLNGSWTRPSSPSFPTPLGNASRSPSWVCVCAFFSREGSPTKTDYRKRVPIPSSLLEDLGIKTKRQGGFKNLH